VTLPPDSSQNAWLVIYIDILMLLTTLLVVLLTLQKVTPQKHATVMKATKVVSTLEQVPLPIKRLPPEPSLKAALPSVAPALDASEKERDFYESTHSE
jgi:hypothetical protein